MLSALIQKSLKIIFHAQFLTFPIIGTTDARVSLERPTLASRVPLFLLGHFLTNECEISDFCL